LVRNARGRDRAERVSDRRRARRRTTCYARRVNTRTMAMTFAAGRVAFGAAMLLAPRKVAHGWIGDDVERPPVELLVRAVGARDLVLGGGALLALVSGQPAKGWLRAGVAADLADTALTGAYLGRLPRPGALGTMVLTVVAAYAGVRLAAGVE
jgi:hypothetical protein